MDPESREEQHICKRFPISIAIGVSQKYVMDKSC